MTTASTAFPARPSTRATLAGATPDEDIKTIASKEIDTPARALKGIKIPYSTLNSQIPLRTQQQGKPLAGVLSSWTLQGAPAELIEIYPWLWLGQWLHAGKNASMGLGGYTLGTV